MAAKSWFYLSFAREGRFLGACIVEAASPEEAPRVAREHAINAGADDITVVPASGPGFLPPYRMFTREALNAIAGLPEVCRGLAPRRDAVVSEPRAIS